MVIPSPLPGSASAAVATSGWPPASAAAVAASDPPGALSDPLAVASVAGGALDWALPTAAAEISTGIRTAANAALVLNTAYPQCHVVPAPGWNRYRQHYRPGLRTVNRTSTSHHAKPFQRGSGRCCGLEPVPT